MRRKLARPGDRISWNDRNGIRKGTVVKKTKDFLFVKLDEPRELYQHEIDLGLNADPYEDTVYTYSQYTIEEECES